MRLDGRFWRFWTATLLANLGDGIGMAAFPLLAASITDDPFAVAAVAAATSIPWLVTGLLAGSLADRHNARTLLVLADLTRIVVLGGLIVVLALGRPPVLLVAVVALPWVSARQSETPPPRRCFRGWSRLDCSSGPTGAWSRARS